MDDYQLVTLFAGAGALDLAAQCLGLSAVGIDWDPGTCATRRAAGLATIEGDVRDHAPSEFPVANFLAAGPPCPIFATAGTGKGRRALDGVLAVMQRMIARKDVTEAVTQLPDVRAGLVLEPLRWALAAIDNGRPYEAIVLTQGPSALPAWRAIGDVLSNEGYFVASGVLRAEQFGDPQTRSRAVLIARRQGRARLPEPTHQQFKGTRNDPSGLPLLPWVSMGEVLERPEPFHLVSPYGSGGNPRARGRRSSEEPAPTVTGKVHRHRVVSDGVTQPERLTAAEAGLLQSFPADYPWSGPCQAQQIGNSTPVLLATQIVAAAMGGEVPGPPQHSDAAVAARMSRQISRDTRAELSLRRDLHAAGLRYRIELPVPGMPRQRIDIAFPRANIAVFVDGCFWHGCPDHATKPRANAGWWRTKLDRNMARDRELTEHLTGRGWTVLRFWEHEEPGHAVRQIKEVLARKQLPLNETT
ncbi:DNA mismatch endonuclease Vsr [Streptomyces sp. SDT5-1]|uniref:DNA mismatch endonuclease Vsr n=1 Tax=Streptomyces sp. SDT5-1 TaxID=3406418 RepID=UPI003FD1DAE4